MQLGLIAKLLAGLGLAPVASILDPLLQPVDAIVDPLLGPLLGTVGGVVSGLPVVGGLLGPLLGGLLGAASVDDYANSTMPYPSSMGMMSSMTAAAVDPASCVVEPYVPTAVLSQTFPPFDPAKANVYRYRQQQSVNLGGWFVLEKWITPSLFGCASGAQVSEYDVASGWGQAADARSVLERHWDSFVTEDDIKHLASIGVNTIRLPIGFWSLGSLYTQGTPYEAVSDVYENSWSRVARAINWAGESGIGVLVDLHGGPGSQNGQPHSGTSTGAADLFTDPKFTAKTMDVLTFLTQQLAAVTNVVGIELLNEPINTPELAEFYSSTISTLRQVSPAAASFPFYIHDAFNLKRFSDFVADRKDFVVQDHHSYFIYTPKDAEETAVEHAVEVETDISVMLAEASKAQRRNLVVGEWTCALPPDSLAKEADPASAQKAFCESQMDVYANTTAGWSAWSYKLEDCAANPGWCFQSAVGTLLPSTFFSYPMVTSPTTPVPSITPGTMSLPSMTEVDKAPAHEPALPMSMANTTLPKRAERSYQHRFMAIHAHRRHLSTSARKRSPQAPEGQFHLTSTEKATAKGYSDGFVTAKIFAEYGWSRLGFTGQYILDSLSTLGPTVVDSSEVENYTEWFKKGLREGEEAIALALASS